VADNIPDPLLEEGTRKASEALGLSLTKLSARLADSKDDADKWLYGTVLEQKAAQLAAEAAALPGSEEMLAFTAKLQNAGEVPDDYVNEVLVPLIREKSREASRTPLEPGKIAAATVEAVPAVAKDLVLSLKGMAQYAPQALVGAVGGVMEDIGIGVTTPEQRRAAELFGAAAEQGTRETGRLLQRGARKLGALTGGPGAGQAGRLVGSVEVMEDADLDKRIQSDLAYWRRQNLVESGQRDVGAIEALLFDAKSWNRRRDDILEANADLAKQGKPLLLVPPTWEEYSAARKAARPELSKEQVEMISPLGEVFDLTNYIGVGAGAKAAKVGGRIVAEKAIRTAAEEAAAQAAKQAAEAGTVRTLAGSAVESVGRGAGKLAEKPVLRGLASAAIATAAGAEPVSATLAAILGTSRMTRALAKGGPEAIESVGKAIKAPLPAPISNFVQLAKDTGAGATYGTAGMVPFALAADSPEERGALLAGGIIYGGAGGGAASTVKSIGDFGKSYWSPAKDDPTAPRTKGTAYGTQYDAQHSKVAATLDNPTYNRVEGLRALIRPFSDLYVLNEQDYAALPVPGIDLSQGVNSIVLPNGRKAVFVKLGGSALSHEVGEVIFESLPPAQQTSILEAYESAYPADVRDAMRQAYEEKVGFRLSPERAAREAIAENFHAVLNGLPIANLGAKPGFAKSIYGALGSIAEQLGIRSMTPGQGVVTSEALEYTPSFLVRRALENALESMQISAEAGAAPQAPAASPAPATPSAPAPTAPPTTDVGTLVPVPTDLTKPSTELTPGAISGVTGGTPAQAQQVAAPGTQAPKPAVPTVANVTEQQRTTVAGTATPELQAQNEAVLAQNLNKPIEVEYLSAKAGEESGDAAVRLRERQLADRNEQEGVPNPFRAVYGKVVVPTSVFQAKNGKRMIFGFSPDKLIRNIDQLRGWYLERGDKAAADRLYSSEFQQQVRTYLENQSNGYRGDGQRISRPADTDPALYPPENPAYTPVPISEADRNLINFLMGLDPVSPTSVAGQWVVRLAELNGFKPASYVTGAAGKQKPVYNPLTQQLRDAGFDGKLNSAIEQLRIERMTSPAVARPDLASIKPAVQGSVQAGFMPEAAKPEGRRELVNVGLKIGDKVALTKDDVVKAFADEGLVLENIEVRESGTEPTVIAAVSAANELAIRRISEKLNQDAIAVYNPADDSGYLAGPRPENFGGKFLKEYFLMPEQAQAPAMMPKREKPLKGSLGRGDLKFFHYSDTPNKGKIDPKFFGQSGVTGAREQAGLPRAYAYAEGSMLGQDAGLIDARKHYYEGTAPKGQIYDGVEDPLDYGAQANRAKADQMLIDRGFIGIYREGLNGVKQVEFFQPMEVTEAEKPESTGPLAEEAMPILPPLALEEIDYAAQDREFARKKAAGEPLYMPEADEQAGWWMAPDGTLHEIEGDDHHHRWARRYLTEQKAPVADLADPTETLKRAGWIRLVQEGAELYVDSGRTPSVTQRKAVNALASDTETEPRRLTASGRDVAFMPKATEAQETAFKESKVRNEDGSLKPMFHFTTADFSRFGRGDIGYHFGTAEQAVDRGVTTEAVRVWGDSEIPSVREGGRTIPVYLDVKNPLRLRDVGSWDSPSDVLQAIPARLRVKLPSAVQEAVQAFEEWENNAPTSISRAEEARQRGPQVTKALGAIRDGLKALGYDGVVYRNEFESKGQGEDSYIAFDNDQIMPAFTTDTGARWMPKARGITSQLEATLQAIPPKASRQQIEAALRDGVKEKGQLVEKPVKAEEMRDIVDQTGRSFEEFLKENPQATRDEMLDFVRQNQIQVAESEAEPSQYYRYQEPGGENYREVLYTLPDNPDAKRTAQEKYNALVADGYPLAEALRMAEQMTPGFRSTHFADVRNYLAHARVNERVTAGGESMLFVEEIQSDLHQKARTEGYREPLTPDEENALLDRQMAVNREYSAAVKSNNVAEMERLEAEKQALRGRFKRAKSGIPDAPFKKSWHEFVFKNLLRDAVEQGKDWLGWTTGDQQAARYDLSKQIAKVQVMPSARAGRERLWAYDHAGRMVLNQQIDAGTAEQYVGKEVAKKLYEAPELTFRDAVMDEDKTYREVSGIDLKVGGEGMRGFYDEILPRFVDKYLKKYGITTETVSTPGAEDVHAIRITPELRKDVLEKGQPAYMPESAPPLTDSVVSTARPPVVLADEDLPDGPLAEETP
jgi:hypothetical protein